MKKNNILKIIGLALIVAFVISCYYDSEEAINPVIGSNSVCDTTNVTFTKNIQGILSDNCLGCHSNANAASSGGSVKLENYADASTNASAAYAAIQNGTMPLGGGKLSSCAILQFGKWISNGKPQ